MGKKLFAIAILGLLFASCNSGSEEYQKADKLLSKLKSEIKKAKDCSELKDATSGFLGLSFVVDINQCTEEEQNKLEQRAQAIFEYAQERGKVLCE